MALLATCLPLALWAQPANDNCAGAIPATFIGAQGAGAVTTLPFTTDGTTDSGVPTVCSDPGLDQYFTWTATTAGLFFDSQNPGSPGIAVFATCADVAAGTDIACLGTFGSGTLSGWNIGDDVIIQIYDFNGSSSDVAFLLEEFTPAPAPANDECANAVALTLGTGASGTVESATDSGVDLCGGTEDDDVWYSFVAPATGAVAIDLTNIAGSTTDLYHALLDGACGTQTSITCSDPNSSTTNGLTPGATYYVQVYSWTANSGQNTTFDITVSELAAPPANDECAGALPLATSARTCSYTTIDTEGATQSTNPSCTSSSNNDDVWVSFVAPSTEVVFSYVNFNNTSGNATSGVGYSVYDACGGTEVECDFSFGDPAAGSGSQLVTGPLVVGDTYFVQLFLQGSTSFGSFDFCIQEVSCTPPAATVPTFSSASCPAGVTFNVDVTDLGSATSLTITNDAGAPPVAVTAIGVYQVGPVNSASSSTISIVVEHDQDPTCNLSVGTFTVPACPPPAPTGISCTSGGSSAAAYADELDDLSGFTGAIGGGGAWNAGASTPSSGTGATAPSSGAGFIYYEGTGSGGAQAVITSNAIDLTAFEDDAELTFDIHAVGNAIGVLNVGVSSDPAGPFTTVYSVGGQIQGAQADPFLPVGVNVAGFVGQTLYVQFDYTPNGTGFEADLSLDNLIVSACAPAGVCSDPSGLSAQGLGGGDVEVSFTGTSAAIGYDVEYGPSGFTPGTGTIASGTASPVLVSGLAGNATYDFYVTADCGRGSVSAQVGPTSVTLGPDNDFCGGAIPATFIGAQGAGTSTTLPFSSDGTTDSGVPAVCSSPGLDQYFTWTATTAGLLFTSQTPGSPGIAVFASCADVAAGNDIACLNTFGSGTLTGWAIGDEVIIQIYDFDGSSSDVAFILEEFTPPPAPANDECDDAVALTVNPDAACAVTTAGTTAGATASPQTDDVTGTPNDDVWFSFVATDTEHIVSLLNRANVGGGTSLDMGIGLYDGTGGCAALAFVGDSDPETATFSGLTVGTTYILRVYSFSSTAQAIDFDVCVGTVPPPPANDDCTAPVVLLDAAGNPTAANNGTYSTLSATASSEPNGCTNGTADDDVWFEVTAPTAGSTVTITVTGDATFDAVIGVFTGTCGNLTQVASCVDGTASGGTEVFTFTSSFTGGGGAAQSQRAAPTTYLVQVYDFSTGDGSGFTISAAIQAPLPVELARFSARAEGDVNVVEWTAAAEVDLAAYHVERATDPAAFSAFAEVAPRGASGIEAVYAATDVRPAATTYYRLRVEDLDGSTEYSDVVAVTRAGAGGKYGPGLTLAPNPARDYVQVGIAGAPGAGSAPDRTLTLTDAAGRVVRRRTVTGADAVSLRVDVAGLPAGLYLVTAAGAEGRVTERLVIE